MMRVDTYVVEYLQRVFTLTDRQLKRRERRGRFTWTHMTDVALRWTTRCAERQGLLVNQHGRFVHLERDESLRATEVQVELTCFRDVESPEDRELLRNAGPVVRGGVLVARPEQPDSTDRGV